MILSDFPSLKTKRLLHFSQLPGVGSASLRKIVLSHMRGLDILSYSDEDILKSYARNSNLQPDKINEEVSNIIDDCNNRNIFLISPLDDCYPLPLLHIEDFPPLLFIRGRVECLANISCAVVGTREASFLGLSWARQIAEILASKSFCIVSGLALGIDTAAHEGALRGHGPTVAVLAHGVDKITPSSNSALAAAILESGGALVSEHPPGVPPRKQEYVRRNRIQSGLSVCSIVVESGEIGGAIHQGNFTVKQHRRLYCVQPEMNVQGASEFKYDGGKRLMREFKAEPIHNSSDLNMLIEAELWRNDFKKLVARTPLNTELI